MTIKNPADWQAGYMAAMSDYVLEYPLECGDRLAFWAGYAEGRAARRRAAQAYAEGGTRPDELG